MNNTYRITVPRFRWDTTNDVSTAFPLSYNTNAIGTFSSIGSTNIPRFHSSDCGANGIFDCSNVGGGLYAWTPYLGKQKVVSHKPTMSGKSYLPSVFGKKFTPTDLPNLMWWFTGEDLARTQIMFNDPVDRWVNRIPTFESSAQNDMVQAVTSQQPTFQLGWNDMPCLVFDGVDDRMTCQLNTTNFIGYSIYIFCRFQRRNTSLGYFFCNDTTANTPTLRAETELSGLCTELRAYHNIQYGSAYVPKNQYAPPFLCYLVNSANSSSIHYIGAHPYHFFIGQNNTSTITGTNTFSLGSYGASYYTPCEVYEILFYKTTHSLGYETELLKYYFTQKYDIDALWT